FRSMDDGSTPTAKFFVVLGIHVTLRFSRRRRAKLSLSYPTATISKPLAFLHQTAPRRWWLGGRKRILWARRHLPWKSLIFLPASCGGAASYHGDRGSGLDVGTANPLKS